MFESILFLTGIIGLIFLVGALVASYLRKQIVKKVDFENAPLETKKPDKFVD